MSNYTETEWKIFYNDGQQFMKIAMNTDKNNGKLTPVILYNIICMAIEKLFMAYFIKTGNLPFNHTLQDLAEAAKRVTSIPQDLETGLLRMNSFQEICSIDQYNRKDPTWGDIDDFRLTMKLTGRYIEELVK